MSNYKFLIPHIRKWEGGGITDDPLDKGGLTNQGLTYGTYDNLCKVVLHVEPSHDHFKTLIPEQVGLFIKYFWDACNANFIGTQAIAEYIVDWSWGSGGAKKAVQRLLNEKFGRSLDVDGNFGTKTLAAINNSDQSVLFKELHKRRLGYYDAIVKNDPKQVRFLQGWKNRANDIYNKHLNDFVK